MASSNVEDSAFLHWILFEKRQCEARLYTPEGQIFSKNLGTTSKFQLPEGQCEACSILRKLVTTTQICCLVFMHPCLIKLTVQITNPKQNFEVFDIKCLSGNCVFMGGDFTCNIQCQERLQLLYKWLPSILTCNTFSQNIFIKAKVILIFNTLRTSDANLRFSHLCITILKDGWRKFAF
jgi:hypothetical protein